jgi:hypothetical protein
VVKKKRGEPKEKSSKSTPLGLSPLVYKKRINIIQTWSGHSLIYLNGVICFRERNKEERKTQKLIYDFKLILVHIYLLIFVFLSLLYFFLSNQTHLKSEIFNH